MCENGTTFKNNEIIVFGLTENVHSRGISWPFKHDGEIIALAVDKPRIAISLEGGDVSLLAVGRNYFLF